MNTCIHVRGDAREAFEPQVQVNFALLFFQLFDEQAGACADEFFVALHCRRCERAQPGAPPLEVQRSVLQTNHHHRLMIEQPCPYLCRYGEQSMLRKRQHGERRTYEDLWLLLALRGRPESPRDREWRARSVLQFRGVSDSVYREDTTYLSARHPHSVRGVP